jgi:hypothetical protein
LSIKAFEWLLIGLSTKTFWIWCIYKGYWFRYLKVLWELKGWSFLVLRPLEASPELKLSFIKGLKWWTMSWSIIVHQEQEPNSVDQSLLEQWLIDALVIDHPNRGDLLWKKNSIAAKRRWRNSQARIQWNS